MPTFHTKRELYIFISTLSLFTLIQFIPLISEFGYETSVFWGGFFGIGSCFYTAVQWKSQEQNSCIDKYLSTGKIPVLIFAFISFLYFVRLIIIPTCDPEIGVAFWILIPSISLFWGLALGSLIGRYAKSPILTIFLVLFLELIWVLFRLAFEPPIQVYEWFFGWFAGSLYDEAINIPTPLILSRVVVFLFAVAVSLWIVLQKKYRSISLMPFVLAFYILLTKPALHHDQYSVRQGLGSQIESEHFLIYYDESKTQISTFIQDAEFRYWQLQKFFEEDPVDWRGRKIEIFLYPDTDTQYRLMGSRNTMVARPWTHQMHIRWKGEGDSILTHEMAHLFSAPFAEHFMDIPIRYGILLDLGILEGIAAAAQWEVHEIDDHLVSSTLIRNQKAPNVLHLFGPTGFWTQPSGKAYTLMGSFFRWLIDSYGMEKMKKIYASGKYDDVYGSSIQELLQEWEEFLLQEKIPTEEQVQYILAIYERPSIFQKTCPRFVAEQSRLYRISKANQSYKKALLSIQRIRSKIPKQPAWIFEESQILLLDNRPKEALDLLNTLPDNQLTKFQIQIKEELKADIYIFEGDLDKARSLYQKVLASTFSAAKRRILQVKIESLENLTVHGYLNQPTKQNLAEIYLSHGESDIINYLIGLRLFYQDQWQRSIEFLKSPLVHTDLEEQRQIVLLQAFRQLENWNSHKETYNELCTKTSKLRVSMYCEEEKDRVSFIQSVFSQK